MAGPKPFARKRRAVVRAQAELAEKPASLGDEALFEGVKRGSEPHFNALYARYFGRIYGFLLARVRNRADAEELTQEVFTAVFRSAGSFGDRATPLSWIYGVARNTLLNHLRRLQLERIRESRVSAELLVQAPHEWAYTPEDFYRQGRLSEEFERAFALLAPWQLDAFRLRHIEDLPIEEISRRTTRSADAVRSGLYRAKRLLFEAAGIEGGES